MGEEAYQAAEEVVEDTLLQLLKAVAAELGYELIPKRDELEGEESKHKIYAKLSKLDLSKLRKARQKALDAIDCLYHYENFLEEKIEREAESEGISPKDSKSERKIGVVIPLLEKYRELVRLINRAIVHKLAQQWITRDFEVHEAKPLSFKQWNVVIRGGLREARKYRMAQKI